MGLFIVFEGIDGSGKSTQIQILYDTLVQNGYNPILSREPGGTNLGETLGYWIKTYPDRLPITELFLLAAARAEHVAQVIKPALDDGRVVLCDRFIASTIAYQGYARGLDIGLINQMNSQSSQNVSPDLTIFLDLPISTARSRKAGADLDVFEKEGDEFQQKVREGYISMATEQRDRWLLVDGSLPRETICEQAWKRVQELLPDISRQTTQELS